MAGRKKPIASGEPRKRTEAVLLDERERLRIIFDTVGDPIFVKDNASRMILVNQSFYAVFGLDEQAVIGHTLAENVPPEERQFLEVDRRVLDTGQPDEREEALTVNGKPSGQALSRSLTRQENMIVQLIVEGLSNKEISAKLHLSVHTVRAHRSNLMSKLGIHKQVDLFHYAIKAGLAKL